MQKKRIFSFDDLYKKAVSQLPYSKEEILMSINNLYQTRQLIESVSITRANVLENKKRNQIYNYIKENQGSHIREIQRAFNFGPYMAFRHLQYLKKFGLLRSKQFMNKIAYFTSEFDETKDEEILVLKNERTKIILDQINTYKKVRLTDLENNLDLNHGQIQPHLKNLLQYDFIDLIVENNISYYIPKSSVPIEEKEVKIPQVAVSTEKITVKREFDYVGGNIRFKVAVQNNSDMAINNISVTLNPAEQFFWDESIQKISNLPPHNTRGVDFTLIPNACGKSTVFGAISYQDAYGTPHTLTISPKEIAIKCPLVIPQTMSQFDIDELMRNLKKSTSKINYGDISQNLAFNIAHSQIEALDLSRVKVNPSEFTALYSGKVKVTGQQIVVNLRMDQPYIIIEVWANDLTQTTGLLAYLRNLIIISLEYSLKTMEKSDEVVRKITQVFSYNNELKECFDTCCKNEKIKVITAVLIKIKNGLEPYYPNLTALDAMHRWILKFEGMHEEEECIDDDSAIELEYNLIEWIKQLRELVIHDIKLFKDTYEDFDKYSEEFKIGEENIDRNLALIEKIYGLSILNYIIVVHKDNGLALYEAQLSSVDLNPDLISGFITAIQSFGTEISKKDTPVMGLKYQNYNIEIESGDYIRAIILLNGKTNVYLAKALFNFVKEFENQFENQLKSFQGNVSQFRNAKDLFSRAFGLAG